MGTSQSVSALTRRQHISLYFVSLNEGKALPSGRELPEPVRELQQMGFIASAIVAQGAGRTVEFVGLGGDSKMAWKLTDSGRKILKQLGVPAGFEA